jgi:hypothetical protein
MIGFIGTSLHLQSIITADNQWLSQTRSIPYWTTSVFSSTVTNDKRRITSEWTELNRTSRRTEYRSSSPTVRVLLCFIRCHENVCLASRWLSMNFCVCSLPRKFAHQAVAQQWTSSLAPLFRLSGVMSQYKANYSPPLNVELKCLEF